MLERRYRTPVGEADLILRRGHLIVIAEVKYAGANQPVEAVLPSPKQLERIRKTALIFQSRHPAYAGVMVRLDIVVVRPWGRVRLFANVGNMS